MQTRFQDDEFSVQITERIFGAVGTEFGAMPALVACDNVTSNGVPGYFHGCDPRDCSSLLISHLGRRV